MSFVHLHTHSHYSLLDGLSKVEDLVARAKALGMSAVALTDHGVMYGAIDFYKACQKEGIKPIIGVEAYIAPRTRHDKDPEQDRARYHLTLLAKNNTGYKNLIKLTSIAHLEGFYYKPRMDKALLEQYHEGLICLSGCPGSELGKALRSNNLVRGREVVREYIDIFGKENYFLEIMSHPEIDGALEWKTNIKVLAEEFDLPIVGTYDSHYLHKDDKDAHNTLMAINTGGGIEGKGMEGFPGDYSLISPEDAREIFKDIPEAVENTNLVADMVNIEIDTKSWYFPIFPIPEGTTHDEVLRKEVFLGIPIRKLTETPEILERVEFELSIISSKGYSSYFLCVADFLRASKERGIYYNTRGSAAGSLVAYLVGITNINPLSYNLLFERFLNPDRPSLPDIDMDFADDRRDEIISYAREKYGEHAVAQIGTFGTMAARGAVRDVARALGYPYAIGDKISKSIPLGSQGFPMTLDRALEIEPELKRMYDEERDVHEIIDMAKKIEGNVRHLSVHAAGVVISPTGRIDDFSPVQFDPKDEKRIITQYDMYTGGGEGIVNLPKFDFLGLRNLTILKEAVDRIKRIHNVDIDIETIPLDDAKTFELFGRGETTGVFQFASSGMKKWLKEMKPSVFEDLIAMVALYRPGPMAFIPDYIACKHNPAKVKYLDPRMEAILKTTYGIIIYQEDTMRIATDIAGYTRGESDKFRKAIGKKIPAEMAAQKEHFITGCVANNLSEKKAHELWSTIETFAAYGFNKSHAAVYALLAYRTGYLKAHYPAEYMSAIMTAESDNLETVAETIEEAKRMGFVILPPSINESFSDFTVVVEDGIVSNKIRFGLKSIKNLGEEIGKAIIHERKTNGAYTSISQFLERVTHKNLNKKSLEALIQTGAMDDMGERGQLLAHVQDMIEYRKEFEKLSGTTSLFGDSLGIGSALRMRETPAASAVDRLAWEKELLGLYVSGHPLDRCRDRIEKNGMTVSRILTELPVGQTVTFGALIDNIKTVFTKKNEKMGFLTFSDFTHSIEGVVFPQTYQKYLDMMKPQACVAVQGKITERGGERSIMVNGIKEI